MKPNLDICGRCVKLAYKPKDPTTLFWCDRGGLLHPLVFKEKPTFKIPEVFQVAVPNDCEFYMEHIVSQQVTE